MSMLSLLGAMSEVQDVVQFGDSKYGRDSWRQPDPPYDKLHVVLKMCLNHPLTSDAARSRVHAHGAMRHLDRSLRGETRDSESGFHTLAHVAARALIALQLEIEREKGTQSPEKDR